MNLKLSLGLIATALLVLAQDPAVAIHPYVQNVREDSAVVLWTTRGSAGSGAVRFAESPGPGPARVATSTFRQSTPEETGFADIVFRHRAELRGLRPGVHYRYRVLQDGVDVAPLLPLEELAFTTPSETDFQFLVLGDSGDGGGGQQAITHQMLRERPAFVLHAGDLAYQEGTPSQLDEFYLRTYWPLMRRAPFFPVLGNHDYVFRKGAAYLAVHDLPAEGVPESDRGRYYSFDWGNVHFVALDSNASLTEALGGQGSMLRWLEQDLAKTRQKFRIVYFHHAPFPTANYREDSYCGQVRDALTPILERHGVHLVFAGHEHLYQRTKPRRGVFRDRIGTLYVTTGGAGSTVYPPGSEDFVANGAGVNHYLRVRVSRRELQVSAIGLAGEVIDEFAILAAPQLEPDGIRESAGGSVYLAPGSLASVFGSDFAPGNTQAHSNPLPASLAQITVRLDGVPTPLLFAGRNQINFQIPYSAESGAHELRVENSAGAATARIQIQAAAPAVFTIDGHPALVHLDGSLVTYDRPALAGELLSLFLTGLGRPMSPVAEGHMSPVEAVRTAIPVQVNIAGVGSEVLFAGLAPGFIGLNQVNFRVPAQLQPGLASAQVIAGDAASGRFSIPIR